MASEKDKKQQALLATLNEEQWKLWVAYELARKDEQIAELYEITRGIVSLPKLKQVALTLTFLISTLFAVIKFSEVAGHYIISKSEQQRYFEERNNEKNNGD